VIFTTGTSRDTERAHRARRRVLCVVAIAAMSAVACAGAPPAVKTPAATSSAAMTPAVRLPIPVNGIAVLGNQLVDGARVPMQLRGADRMGTEYACVQGWGVFGQPDGPGDQRTDAQKNDATLAAMSRWNINAVRVPVNEDCWLGTKAGLNPRYTGVTYRNAITAWVSQITAHGMVAIVDLHWSAPNGRLATDQQPMADADNSPAFWSDGAAVFKSNPNVIFDVFNEPYLDRDNGLIPDMATAWRCWRDGCRLHVHSGETPMATTYQAAGMSELVAAIRQTGASNPIMLGGLSYAQNFSQFLNYLPTDPAHNLIASFHAYLGNDCGLVNNACRSTIASLMTGVPLVTGEFGLNNCASPSEVTPANLATLNDYLTFMDTHQGSYVAWTWTVPDPGCTGFSLIIDDDSGAPSPTGVIVRTHYQAR
jgi:endoglucanase